MTRESEFLKKIPRNFITNGIGVGDDAALLPEGLLITVDTLVEGRHFILKECSYTQLASKLIGVNRSDIAAMGGKPLYALLALSCGPNFDAAQFLETLLEQCKESNIFLVGGDTVAANETVLSLTLLGQAGAGVARRDQAKEGDIVFVSGPLGAAVKSGRHLSPPHRVVEGQFLVAQGVRCMMDLSDGLAQGLHCLAHESAVKIEVDIKQIPLHPDSSQLENAERQDSAFFEGEDFELLATASEADWDKIKEGQFAFHPIGRVVQGQGVFIQSSSGPKALENRGYEHQW